MSDPNNTVPDPALIVTFEFGFTAPLHVWLPVVVMLLPINAGPKILMLATPTGLLPPKVVVPNVLVLVREKAPFTGPLKVRLPDPVLPVLKVVLAPSTREAL